MGIFDKGSERKKEYPEEGKYAGVLYLLADLGTHPDTYEGKPTRKHKAYVAFELVGTKMSDGRPFVVGEEFTLSESKFGGYYISATSNLYKMLKSWSGSSDVRKDLGVLSKLLAEGYPASILVGVKDRENKPGEKKVYIESVKPYKGTDKPIRVNEPVDGIVNPTAVWDKLPGWIKKKIENSLERTEGYTGGKQAPEADSNNASDNGDDDFRPF